MMVTPSLNMIWITKKNAVVQIQVIPVIRQDANLLMRQATTKLYKLKCFTNIYIGDRFWFGPTRASQVFDNETSRLGWTYMLLGLLTVFQASVMIPKHSFSFLHYDAKSSCCTSRVRLKTITGIIACSASFDICESMSDCLEEISESDGCHWPRQKECIGFKLQIMKKLDQRHALCSLVDQLPTFQPFHNQLSKSTASETMLCKTELCQ